ncbi:MAG: hypothetical protein JWQ10_413, partial [Herbaspirillum sp.]|nr:hypothetical protein [Herbaspirillum sp.]
MPSYPISTVTNNGNSLKIMNAPAARQIGQSGALKSVRSLSAEEIWGRAEAHRDIDSWKQEIPQAIRLNEIDASLAQIRSAGQRVFRPPATALKLQSRAGTLVSGLLAVSALPGLRLRPPAAEVGAEHADDPGRTRFWDEGAGMAPMHPPHPLHPLHEQFASPPPIFDAADLASPSSAPASNTDATLPGNAGIAAPVPAPGWIAAIDWRAFDEVDFLQLDARADLADRLRGMAERFHRSTDSGKLPLDITQFDRPEIERFAGGVMRSMGYGEQTTMPTDPAFLQTLFKRWFLQLAAPQAGGYGNGGNSGNIAPLHDELLRLTHPASATLHRSQCSDGGDARAAPSLPRIGALKSELRLAYLASYRRLDADHGLARKWAFESLCQLFEPTLVRSDLPDAFRYGSLDWTLLSIGIALAGDAHIDLSVHQLIALAAAADIFAGDPADAGLLALRRQAMHAILRMAHAHGKLNLLDLPEIKPAHLETAFDFYQSQLQAERNKLATMEDLIARLPTRSDIAKTMLRERGFRDPERHFAVTVPQDLVPPGMWGNQLFRRASCMPEGSHALHEIFMMDCLLQLRSGNYLSGPEHDLLKVPQLTHDKLNERFERTFDEESTRLMREILVPALQKRIADMDAEDEKFWRCGEWEVRLPTVWGETQFTGGPYNAARRGSVLAAERRTWIEYTAKNGVLIRLTLGTGAQQKIRSYWAALDPFEFELHRYDGNDALLLSREKDRFFKPEIPGNKLLRLSSRHAPSYEAHTAGNADGDLLQTISARLLSNRLAPLREAARETTGAEASSAQMLKLFLDLLPLHACVTAIQAGKSDEASLSCTLDALGILPLVKAGKGLSQAARAAGAGLTRSEIKNLALLLLKGSVKQADASKPIAVVLRVGPPAVKFAQQGVRLFDPGFELLHGLSALSFRLGKAGVQRLAQAFGGMTELQPLMRRLEQGGRQVEKFYPGDGFWHAQKQAIAHHDGGRHIEIGGRHYGVFDIGENKNILVLPDGAALRLANPQSALGYGPLLRSNRLTGRLELMPQGSGKATGKEIGKTVRKEGARVADAPALCRSKRAEDAYSMICQVPLAPDARFGANGYAQQEAPTLTGPQLSVAEPGGTVLRQVNLLDIGYEVSRLNQQTYQWIPEAPLINSYYDPATGHLLAADSTVPFPEAFSGTVVRLRNAAGRGVSEYVKIETAYIDAPNDILLTTRYMPFFSYQDINGVVVGQFALGGLRHSFRADGGRMLGAAHQPVSIYRTTSDEINKLHKYQELLEFKYDIERINYRSILKFSQLRAPRRQQFEVVLDRAEMLLRDAVEVLNTQADIARKICARFAVDDGPAATEVMNAVKEKLEYMLQSFPFFRSQVSNVVGF